jgi:D-arabinan exo alpha-(1,3)/(1,5)-arabinofuranosidase (non-reducing end)
MAKKLECSVLAVVLAACEALRGQEPPGTAGLARLKQYSAHRVSSDNPNPSSNDDSKRILPGETLVMADLIGPGMVTHVWVTVADNEFAWPRLLRLRVYYDGHKTPSVDAPLGDFFGVGHGLERDLNSMMVRNSSFGRARNSYWPMPYRKSCRITVTNEGNRQASLYYYHVDYRKYAALPADMGYLHAYYRQERPARNGRYYEFLNVRGNGHYVGTVLSVVQTQVGWFGEGDDLFYVDGATHPQIYGTGTEDYFNDAWGLRVTDGAWAGTTLSEGQEASLHFNAYRWHVPDPIPFTRSLHAQIEHSGWTFNSDGTVRSGFEERPDFFSSVAFWYQQGVNEGLPEPPYGEARLPLGNAQQIAVEDSLPDVTTSRGKASVQREVDWGKDLLAFEAEGVGSRINVPIDVTSDGQYEVLADVAQAPDYGDYAVLLDGKLTNSTTEVWPANDVPPPGTQVLNNYAGEVYVARDRLVGWFQLTKGRHALSFVCAGKDSRSAGYNLGINDVVLAKVSTAEPSDAAIGEEPKNLGSSAQVTYRGRLLSSYVTQLKNAGGLDRPELLRAIGSFGADATPAIQLLVEALADSSASVRAAAAWALTQTGPRGATAVPALAKALSDPAPRVRGLAIIALKNMGPKSAPAVPELIHALNDSVSYLRAPAAVALGEIGPNAKDAIPALEEAIQARRLGSDMRETIRKIEGRPSPALF